MTPDDDARRSVRRFLEQISDLLNSERLGTPCRTGDPIVIPIGKKGTDITGKATPVRALIDAWI